MSGGGRYTAYFDESLNDAEITDKWIERLDKYSFLLGEKGLDESITYYVSDEIICNYRTTKSEGTVVSFSSGISEEEGLAWVLNAVSENEDLPYGIYAGLSAHWLDKEDYSLLIKTSIAGAGCLTDLQFPLYEQNNMEPKEREFAWNFSYTLVKDWLDGGRTETQLTDLTKEQLNDYLEEEYRISLPDYEFSPYSSQYEYKVLQDRFTYYINKEYRDLILPEEDFTTAYDDLCDWLEDNRRVQRDADELFDVYNMYDINIYLDDGKKSTGRTGESRRTARENYIRLYSVGGFSFCYIYHVFSHIGEEGFLSYTICQSRADKSEYAKLAHYYLLTVQASYPYSEKVKEKESYLETLKLYNKKSITPASAETFNFWLYADCFLALYTEEGKSFINMLQDLSRLRYIDLTYGEEYIAKLNADLDILIEGKTFDEVTREWRDYLQILKEE